LTQNFISKSELPEVLNFFKNKENQVSGFKKTSKPEVESESERNKGEINQVDQEVEDDDESYQGLFQLFSSRLKEFDQDLWKYGMEGMEKLETDEKNKSLAFCPLNGAKRRNGGGWWERLKKSNGEIRAPEGSGRGEVLENTEEEQDHQAGFGFGLDLDGEELEEVPW